MCICLKQKKKTLNTLEHNMTKFPGHLTIVQLILIEHLFMCVFLCKTQQAKACDKETAPNMKQLNSNNDSYACT